MSDTLLRLWLVDSLLLGRTSLPKGITHASTGVVVVVVVAAHDSERSISKLERLGASASNVGVRRKVLGPLQAWERLLQLIKIYMYIYHQVFLEVKGNNQRSQIPHTIRLRQEEGDWKN